MGRRAGFGASVVANIPEPFRPKPCKTPAQTLDKLDGTWKMVYTSSSELIAVMALSKLPFVGVGDVTQRIDVETLTVENKVGARGAGARLA